MGIQQTKQTWSLPAWSNPERETNIKPKLPAHEVGLWQGNEGGLRIPREPPDLSWDVRERQENLEQHYKFPDTHELTLYLPSEPAKWSWLVFN